MAIKTQSIICRRMTALDKNQFSHQDLKYKFAGWAVSRSRANSGIVDYTDQQQLSVVNDAPDMELYAVWRVRDTITTYENLKITSSNVTYDKTTAPVFYTVTEVKTYEGLATPYSKVTIANDVAVASNPFSTNGDPTSDYATQPRTLTISYTHPKSGLVATTNITQGGYTPVYKLYVNSSKFGTIYCYSGTQPLVSDTTINGLTVYSSTNKNFSLKAEPKVQTDTEWISKSGCAYYKRDYATRLKHAAAYPKSNGCGSWKTITTKLYDFKSWSGSSIDGITADQVVVQGSVSNPPIVSANFVKAPLLKNAVIGTWNATWQISHTTYQTYTDYRTSTSWVPTCKTGLKYFRKYGITTMHEGKLGHGYYKVTKTPYTATKANTTYTTYKNRFYGASSVDAPYVLYVPADGQLRIKGKFGTAVFGKAEAVQTGGFAIKKYSFTQNVYDDYLTFYGKADATNNYVIDIDKTIPVKKGDKLQFTKPASKMALWIESIELTETT